MLRLASMSTPSAQTAEPAPPPGRLPPAHPRFAAFAQRHVWHVLVAASAIAVAWFGYLVSQRIGYPFELEWMEGALADHALRVSRGEPIYCPPTPEHVPFLYAPLLFWLGGGGIALGLDGILALRLVALASSLGVAALIGHWVKKETDHVLPGLVAVGVFLAGYGWLYWWYDLARNDSPFLLSMLLCAYALRHGGRHGWWVAALLAMVAVLAKQSAAMWLPAVGVGALILDWRKGVKFGFAGVGAIVLALGVMHLSSEGWSTFYLFEMPTYHGSVEENKLGFWTRDLWPMLPLVVAGIIGFVSDCRAGRGRAALFLAAVGSGGLVTSWLSRIHVGGFDNVLLYGFAGACVLGPIAAARLRFLPWLLVVQFVFLFVFAFAPSRVRDSMPSDAHRKAHEELFEFVSSQPRDVFLPGHGYITSRAGKPTSAHGQAIFDLMQTLPYTPSGDLDVNVLADEARLQQLTPKVRDALVSYRDGMYQAMATKHYSAIVLDEQIGGAFLAMFAFAIVGPDGRQNTPDDPYRRRPGQLLSNPPALSPPVGFTVHSPFVLEAR